MTRYNRFLTDLNLEWRDDTWAHAFANVVLLILGAVALWFFVNSPAGLIKDMALVYMIMILFVSIVWVLDYVWEDNPIVESVTLGSKERAIKGVVVGAIVALIFMTIASIMKPTALLQATASIASFPIIFFIVIVAGVIEEAFFRGHIIPTAARTLGSLGVPFASVFGILIGNLAFGYFHLNAYGGDVNLMMVAVMFGIAATLGNIFFKSTAFGIGMHITNNFFAVMAIKSIVGG